MSQLNVEGIVILIKNNERVSRGGAHTFCVYDNGSVYTSPHMCLLGSALYFRSVSGRLLHLTPKILHYLSFITSSFNISALCGLCLIVFLSALYWHLETSVPVHANLCYWNPAFHTPILQNSLPLISLIKSISFIKNEFWNIFYCIVTHYSAFGFGSSSLV